MIDTVTKGGTEEYNEVREFWMNSVVAMKGKLD